MSADFLSLTPENFAGEHLCCIIRTKKPHPGVEAKRCWLAARLEEGHVFRKLNEKATVFIEYAPLETAWVPIEGENFIYIYCLWACGPYKGKGHGRALMEGCIAGARKNGKAGLCMLGAAKQKAWLSDQAFAKKFGFKTVDTAPGGYELLALSFDGTLPRFAPNAKSMKVESQALTIYYSAQCPYTWQSIEMVRRYCEENAVPVQILPVESLAQAKQLPCVFNNWAVFYKGSFETVNLLDIAALKRILKK
ncbi:MAG: GNAT family N-acetyltransferase [Oscillospiraceae bacterium]|jgi:GNAT superfamily N-acetyltransferase|nr:MAG: GNAT family N-acetyltransferase [Oscillospiraceae bacterium]